MQGRCIAGGNTGCLRQATVSDRELILSWARENSTDTGSGVSPNEGAILRKRSRGQFYLFGIPDSRRAWRRYLRPVEGVTRVQFVYTPPNLRNNGYAASVVAHASNSAPIRGFAASSIPTSAIQCQTPFIVELATRQWPKDCNIGSILFVSGRRGPSLRTPPGGNQILKPTKFEICCPVPA